MAILTQNLHLVMQREHCKKQWPFSPETYTRSWQQEQCNKQLPFSTNTCIFWTRNQNSVTNHGPSQPKPTFGMAKLLAPYIFKAVKVHIDMHI